MLPFESCLKTFDTSCWSVRGSFSSTFFQNMKYLKMSGCKILAQNVFANYFHKLLYLMYQFDFKLTFLSLFKKFQFQFQKIQFQNMWKLYLEVNIFASKFLQKVALILWTLIVCGIHNMTFLTKFGVNDVTTRNYGDGKSSGFCNVQKLTWEMNCSPKILYGYWFWSIYHCRYIMYKFRSFLTQFCINDVITGEKVLKILKSVS